jgi:hypothetical protein
MTQVKFLQNNAGALAEAKTTEVSTGAGSASTIPNLNASGVLDLTIVNGTVTSAGAGSSGKLPVLDSSGKLDITTMPTGVTIEAQTFTTTEAIAAGDCVNIWNSSGQKVRKADASNGRPAHGYAPAGAGSGASCTVYFDGINSGLSGKTPGATQFLSATTPGATTETAPSTTGQIVQVVGTAMSSTSFLFEQQLPITLA